jgi:hypothetical protein
MKHVFHHFYSEMCQDAAKSTTQTDFRCDICCKTFMSVSTYSQHIASLKHKQRRKQLLDSGKKKILKKSKSASSSEFSVLSCEDNLEHKHESSACMFCAKEQSDINGHLLIHNFPPFKQNCKKPTELRAYVQSVI